MKKTIYIHGHFDTNEYEAINAAGAEWTYATNGLIKYNFIYGFDLNTYNTLVQNKDAIVIFKLPEDDKITDGLDNFFKMKILGCYYMNKPMIIYVIPNRINSIFSFEKIVAHELGHALGLQHVDNNLDVMNQFVYEYGKITKYDIVEIIKTLL